MTDALLPQLNLNVDEAARLPTKVLQRLLAFLLRWHDYAAALAILDAHGPSPLVSLYDLRAEALAGAGRQAEAGATMAERLQLKESNSAWLHLAKIHALGHDDAGAFAVLNRLVHQPDAPPAAWHLLGDVYLRHGNQDGAEAAYLRGLKLNPEDRGALAGLAELHLARRQPVQAAAYAVRAYTVEEGQSAPTVDLLRRLLAFFRAAGDANRQAAAAEQLSLRFSIELAAMRDLAAGEAAHAGRGDAGPAAGQSTAPARRSRRAGVTPARPQVAALPDLAAVPISAAERAELLAGAQGLFGFAGLLPAQAEIMACVRRGENVLAVLPTGAGKSLCYQLPAFMDGGISLVVSPLIALMKDQVDGLPPALRGQAIAINSSLEGRELRQALAALRGGQYRLVYAAPERLRQPPFLYALAEAGLTRLVIDEAHCVSIWGHDFRPDYLSIARVAHDLGDPPILALTATAPPRVREDILNRLFGPAVGAGGPAHARLIMTDTYRPNLTLGAVQVRDKDEKLARLVALCGRLEGSGIVYVPTRRDAEELAQVLQQRGITAGYYHAGLEPPARTQAQEAFMHGDTRVVVATVAFGMGIDKPDIRFIIHYGLPDSVEAYYQEAGRAGRDGQPAHCILLYSAGDRATLSRHAAEGVLSIDFLRQVYAAAARRLRGRNPGVVPLVALMADVAGEETDVRVALSILEQTGLLARTCDAPAVVSLRWNNGVAADDTVLARLRAVGGDRDFLALAAQGGIPPGDLERKLLAWQGAGYLEYQPGSRDPLLSLPPAPADASLRIDSLLSQYTAIQQQRVTEIWDFARTAACRHGHLANYLGGAPRPHCAACDNCLPAAELPFAGDDSDGGAAAVEALQTILAALAEHGWGRRNLTLLLRGEPRGDGRGQGRAGYGSLRHRSEAAIGKLIDALLAAGYLEEKMLDHGGVTLGITPEGRRAIAGQTSLAGLVAPRPPVRRTWNEVGRPARAGPAARGRAGNGSTAARGDRGADAGDVSPVVAARFERLRAWRAAAAREQRVPAYVVAHDTLLWAIAGAGPRSQPELAAVPGMGTARLEKYGAAILQILAAA